MESPISCRTSVISSAPLTSHMWQSNPRHSHSRMRWPWLHQKAAWSPSGSGYSIALKVTPIKLACLHSHGNPRNILRSVCIGTAPSDRPASRTGPARCTCHSICPQREGRRCGRARRWARRRSCTSRSFGCPPVPCLFRSSYRVRRGPEALALDALDGPRAAEALRIVALRAAERAGEGANCFLFGNSWPGHSSTSL
jgi:hypothetical protein